MLMKWAPRHEKIPKSIRQVAFGFKNNAESKHNHVLLSADTSNHNRVLLPVDTWDQIIPTTL
jgi:hypothetical protein